jgi:hypothetical protein
LLTSQPARGNGEQRPRGTARRADEPRRLVEAFRASLVAFGARRTLEDVLRELLPVVASALEIDGVLIQVREGDRLRSVAALGVEEGGESYSVPLTAWGEIRGAPLLATLRNWLHR